MWYKYRYNTSAHASKWSYTYLENLSSKEDLGEHFQSEVSSEVNIEGEHYRGVEWKKVKIEDVPQEVINKMIETEQNKLKYAKQRAKEQIPFLKEQVKKCKKKDSFVKCTACKGKGKVSFIPTLTTDCKYCNGTGKKKDYNVY